MDHVNVYVAGAITEVYSYLFCIMNTLLYTNSMTVPISARLEDKDAKALDLLVERGVFKNRAEALRLSIVEKIAQERERAIAESYKKAYSDDDQSDFIDGASLLGDIFDDA